MNITSRQNLITSLRTISAISIMTFLTACGGSGGGSTPPAYSAIGIFAGTATGLGNAQGTMDLSVNSDGSGEFGIQFPGHQAEDFSFGTTVGQVSGGTFTIANAQLAFAGYATNCPFTLSGHMVSANEMDGSYTLGDGSAACQGNEGTVPFRITRAALSSQSFQKSSAPIPLIKTP